MFEIVIALWLLLSIFLIYIFCAAARRFVSEPEQEPAPPDNVVVVHRPNSPGQPERTLPRAKMRACGD